MSYGSRRAPERYAFGLAMLAAAVLLRFALQPLLGASLPFLTLFAAVVMAAWFGGWRVGLLVAGLSAVAAERLFMDADWKAGLPPTATVVSVIVFLASCALMISLTETMHRAEERGAALRRQLEDELKARRLAEERLRILAEVSTSFGEVGLSTRQLAGLIAQRLSALVPSGCSLRVLEGGTLRLLGAHHVDQEARGLLTILRAEESVAHPLYAEVVAGGRTVVTVGAAPISYGAPVPEELRAALERFGPRHLIVAPMRIPRGVVGTIAIATHRDEPYTDADRLLVEAVAGRAGLALENASLMEQAQRARRDAEAASRLKDEFLTTLSHELRTPLNAIVGWSHMLRSGRLEAGQVTRGAEVIHRNAMAQTRLVSDILDMQRIVSGRLRLDLRDVDLIDVVASAIDTVKPAAEARAIEIVRILDPAAAAGWGDPERLQQVAWNLLSNAVKFTPRGGRVLVRLSRVESHLELQVVDNGPGIPPEFLPHVFERFRQADGSATRQHGGLGLGLSIVRSLVELHGGTVEAANVADGSGAAFTVRLPRPHVTADERRPAPERRRPVAEADVWLEEAVRLDGTRVLVVDDDPDGRELVAAALAGCGADVLAATSGPEALELLGRQPVDALVCDIHMPAMDGYELVRRLRRLPASEGGHTPAAALTAAATTADRMRALASGFQMHVAKPVQPAELATVVASLAAIGRGLRPRS